MSHSSASKSPTTDRSKEEIDFEVRFDQKYVTTNESFQFSSNFQDRQILDRW
jgi:hypothetical protein